MIYSFSRLNLYSQCPYRFRLKYIEGREEPVTKPLALGKGTHKGVEEQINKDLTVQEATSLGLIEADFHPEVSYDEMAKLIENAPVDEVKFLGVETELHFVLPLSDSPSTPKVQGYIDLVLDGGFIDWKTNWRSYGVWENMQIPLYAWGATCSVITM